MTPRLLDSTAKGVWLLVTLWMLMPVVLADCVKDLGGDVYCGAGRCLRGGEGAVWCSRFYDGGAQRTRDGTVLCGKGQCEKTLRGQVFCSSEVGGAATKDVKGRVRCYGQCEAATVAYCEQRRAGSAP